MGGLGFPDYFLPERRPGIFLLLEAVEPENLTPAQVARIRELMFLNPPDSEKRIEDLVREGKIHV